MRVLLAVLIALVLAAPAAADVEYTVTDLSAAGAPTLDAWGVNDDGVVVGTMNTGAPYNGFRWTERLGLRAVEGKNAIPRDVSPSGVAVGLYDRPGDIFFVTGARWDVFGTIGSLMPAPDPQCPPNSTGDDCDGSYARGIGPDDVAVGATTINGGQGADYGPAYWLPSATTGILLENAVGALEARNAAGWMVGTSGQRAAVWRSAGDKILLPLLEQGVVSQARDVSDAGVVVGDGATRPTGRNRAFTWTEAEGLRRLDTLGFGTEAHAISARGEIVGKSRVTDDDAGQRAVRWVNREIADLNTLIGPDSGWTLIEAHDVNANGWIVGRGVKDGAQRAFLLRPAPALELKVEGAGWDPFNDTYVLKATVRNVGTAPVTDLRLAQDLTPVLALYPPDKRAIVVRLDGPAPGLPDRLEPGQSAETYWLEQADAPGFVTYVARVTATARGINQTYAGSVEISVGEPAPLTLGDLYVLMMGGMQEVSDDVRARMLAMHKQLTTFATKAWRGKGKLPKIKPSPAEIAWARALHKPDDFFAAVPNNAGEGFDLVKTAYLATERAKVDVLKSELGGAKQGLVAAGKFIDRWTSADGLSELRATSSELIRMGRNGELTGGLVADAGKYWGAASVSPESRAETQRQLLGLRDDTIKAAGATYDKTVAAGKKEFADFSDTLSRDPKKAVDQLFYAKSKLETKAAVEYVKSMAGDKLMKSLPLLRRLEKTAGGVDDVVEAADDERRLVQLAEDGLPKGTLTAGQAAAYTGMTKEMNEKVLAHAQTLAKRYPGVDLRISFRPLGKGDVAKLKAGLTPKIEAIPIKKVNDIDVRFLGADKGALNEVGYFTPTKPSRKVLNSLNAADREAVLERYAKRLDEARAMAGSDIDDKVLQAKVGEMRKAISKKGHTFEESVGDRVIRKTELKLGVKSQGNVKLLKNEGLTINGRSVGTRGKGFTGDLDTESILNGVQNLPAGTRGSIELSWQEALRSDPDLPFGFHGWGGFDLTAADKNHVKLVLAESISHLKDPFRLQEAKRLAAMHNLEPADLLRTRRNGFVITVTSKGFEVVR